jgi:DNA-binding winged helix-turn-helix (wHTH) protein/tetratricopeptide (TPR) repeat protein
MPFSVDKSERTSGGNSHRVAFDRFELDLRSGELRKDGRRIRMQAQPFQLLALLIKNAGEVVTRDEVSRTLWQGGTFVDFDHGVAAAVNKIRETLGDSAENPRFVETLPKRGYRFIGKIRPEPPVVLAAPEAQASVKLATVRAAKARTGRNWILGLAAIAVALVTGILFVWPSRQARRLTEKESIVLGDFANSTGDGVFDGTLREGLSVELEQSPSLKLVSEEQIHQTLRMMGQKADVQLTREIAREVCQRTNSAATLDGSIALIGTRYELILRAVDCASGDLLASGKAQAIDKSGVLDALGNVASELRRKLGESLSTVQKYNTPLVQATTPSLEALQFYTLGLKTVTQTGDFAASLPWFQRAIEYDPNFAMAYWAMGDAYSGIGETTSQATYTRRAFELRAGLSERERLVIEGNYYYYVTGDIIKARHSFELCAKLYPDSNYAHTILGNFSNTSGQYDVGLHEYQEAIRLAPRNSILHRYVVFTNLLLDRVADAAAAAKEAQAVGLDSDLAPVLYEIAFYQNDSGEMARQAARAAGRPGVEDLLLAMEADTAAFFGHLGEAREFSRHAADTGERTGEKEAAAGYSAVSALREALFGNAHKARQQATTAKEHSTGRDLDYGVALAFAYAGDARRAQALTDDLGRKFPEDTVVKFTYLPTLRAKLALNRSNSQQALELLGITVPYELGLPSSTFYNWPNLYPVYVRGEAYLAARRGGEAAAEFQKILDHRSIVLNEPIGVLAHLQLGRAYVLCGDTAKASSAYRNFLALWRDADPDIPILKQAKAEYAKVQ